MTLEKFLQEEYPTMKPYAADKAFAAKVGVARQSITRYRLFEQFPVPTSIARIRDASRGLVDAADHMPPSLCGTTSKGRTPARKVKSAAISKPAKRKRA